MSVEDAVTRNEGKGAEEDTEHADGRCTVACSSTQVKSKPTEQEWVCPALKLRAYPQRRWSAPRASWFGGDVVQAPNGCEGRDLATVLR